MQITQVELYPVETRRRNGDRNHHVALLIDTDTNITGLGEFSDLSHKPAVMPDLDDLQAVLNQVLVGIDPTNLTRVEELLTEKFPRVAKSGLVNVGIETACHDITAKSLDVSLSEFLGGAKRDRIPICYPIFRTQSVDEVPRQLEYVEMASDRGFDAIRYYFGADLDADERFLSEVEEQFGGAIQVKSLDASGRFTWKEALSAYNRLERFDFIHLESPVPRDDVDGLARVTERIDRPVSEHVHSLPYALELIEHKAVDIINSSLTNIGGIRNMRRLHGLADAVGIDCLVGTTQEMSIGTAAQAQTAAVAECPIRHSDPVGPFLYTEDVVNERVQYEDGHLIVPDGPGLGLEVDRDKLADLHSPLTMVEDGHD